MPDIHADLQSALNATRRAREAIQQAALDAKREDDTPGVVPLNAPPDTLPPTA